MLAILDYKAGNQTSVRRALEHLGIPCAITADPAALDAAQGIIFPGVGAAGQAMGALRASGLDQVLRRAVERGRPLLGICLGCQILLERSEENDTPTLGLVPGVCRRFADGMRQEDGTPAPVPHMGWNDLTVLHPCELTGGTKTGDYVYFVHSFCADTPEENISCHTVYGERVPAPASTARSSTRKRAGKWG